MGLREALEEHPVVGSGSMLRDAVLLNVMAPRVAFLASGVVLMRLLLPALGNPPRAQA